MFYICYINWWRLLFFLCPTLNKTKHDLDCSLRNTQECRIKSLFKETDTKASKHLGLTSVFVPFCLCSGGWRSRSHSPAVSWERLGGQRVPTRHRAGRSTLTDMFQCSTVHRTGDHPINIQHPTSNPCTIE